MEKFDIFNVNDTSSDQVNHQLTKTLTKPILSAKVNRCKVLHMKLNNILYLTTIVKSTRDTVQPFIGLLIERISQALIRNTSLSVTAITGPYKPLSTLTSKTLLENLFVDN